MTATTSPPDLQSTLQLAAEVAMPQGAIFIRELLREKRRTRPSVRIGVGKKEIGANLEDAIRSGAIGHGDLEAWLGEVEGWGRQHAYLYRRIGDVRDDPAWQSEELLRKKLAAAGVGDQWQSSQSPSFPDELVPGFVNYEDGRFELVWRQRREKWVRDSNEDKAEETIRGYTYEFRAHYKQLSRAVMRFVLIPAKFRAALFIQLPLGDRHDAAKRLAEETLKKIFAFDKLKPVNISKAIKALDTLDLKDAEKDRHGQVQSQNAKFKARGATVEFDADPKIVAWKRVKAVRDVRRALKTRSFEGVHGRFIVSLRSGPGMKRDREMSLVAADARVYFRAQMNATEVWTVLDQVRKHGR